MDTSPNATVSAPAPYYAPVDGARSLCVLLVLINHIKFTGPARAPFINGHRGVDIFFVISGFLITALLLREERATGRIDLPAFYWRRAFRILPIYTVVLLLYIAVCQLPSQATKWVQLKGGLPYFLTMMNEYVREPNHGTVFTHTWSLGVEEKFYLLWPVLFFVVFKKSALRSLVLPLLFIPVAIAPWVHQGFLGAAYFGLLMGCLMAVLLSSEASGFARSLRRIPSPVMVIVLFMGFYLENRSSDLIAAFSAAIVLFLSFMIVKQTWLSRLFSARPLVWLGRRSYSMYLVHVLCINVVEAGMRIDTQVRAATALLLGYTLTAALAAVLFVVVEEPCRLYGRRFIAQRRASRQRYPPQPEPSYADRDAT